MTRHLLPPAITALFMLISGLAATAQPATHPEVAMVVLSPTPLAKGHAVVERRASLTPHDVVLVDDGATQADVASAVQVLSAMRAQVGDDIPVNVRAVVSQFTPPAGWHGGTEETHQRQQLQRMLARSHLREVAGYGRVHAIPVVVPVRAVRKRDD